MLRCRFARAAAAVRVPPPPLRRAAPAARAATSAAAGGTPPGQHQHHVPVLLPEVLGFLCGDGRAVRVALDGTLGAGGHAAALLAAARPALRALVGFDLDADARALAGAALAGAGAALAPVDARALLAGGAPPPPAPAGGPPTAFIVGGNFASLGAVLPRLALGGDGDGGGAGPPRSGLHGRVDAALLDLGVSSMQLDRGARGFSFARDGPLDMRLDAGAGGGPSAADLVNGAPEAELGRILREYGEERRWAAVAARLAAARAAAPIETTAQLAAAVGGGRGRDGLHPATRAFQALRIAVNGELAALEAALPAALAALAPGGRLAVISFHSLEDRAVKWAFRRAAGLAGAELGPGDDGARPRGGSGGGGGGGGATVRILTKRPVVAGDAEVRANPRARSAKLRVVEKLPP